MPACVLGLLSRTVDSLAHPDDRFAPNAVLAGGTADLDLNRLVRAGVRPHGRLLDGTVLTFAVDLVQTYTTAEAHAVRFGLAVDEDITRTGADAPPAAERPAMTELSAASGLCRDRRALDLPSAWWASSGPPDSPPIGAGSAGALSSSGEPSHTRGVSPLAGLYFLGVKWQHRRSSHTIDGVGRDAEYLAGHIAARFAERAEFELRQTILRDGVAA